LCEHARVIADPRVIPDEQPVELLGAIKISRGDEFRLDSYTLRRAHEQCERRVI
jgi:hypothetical protein